MSAYITVTELGDLGLNPAAFSAFDLTKKLQAIKSASGIIDGYLGRFTLPLTAWGDDVKQCCASLASIRLLWNRGTSADADDRYAREEKRWLDWLLMVSVGTIKLMVTDSSSGSAPGITAIRPVIFSSAQRGFSVRGTGLNRGPFQGD